LVLVSNRPGLVTDELALLEGVDRVPIPPVSQGNQWLCPNCELLIPPLRVQFHGKPPKYRHSLHDIIRCPWCKFCFAPVNEALVLRA
jgi:hypothetical protein